MDISVIIVSWNAKEYLRECLNSLVQELRGYDSEILVVDNASSDGSDILIQESFPDCKLIQTGKNLGFAKANNIGIKESSGRYLFLINSDITLLDGCIRKILLFLEMNPAIGILGPQIINPDGYIQRSCMEFPNLWNTLCNAIGAYRFSKSKLFGGQMMTYWKHDTTRRVDIINGCFWAIRRESLKQVGLLDERFFIYGEDIDYCRRFNQAGWEVVFFPLAKAIHYQGASSSNAPVKFYMEKEKANFQLWQKYHNSLSQFFYLIILLLHHGIRITINLSLFWSVKKRESVILKLKRSMASMGWLLKNGLKQISSINPNSENPMIMR